MMTLSKAIAKTQAAIALNNRKDALKIVTSFWTKNKASRNGFIWVATTLVDMAEDALALEVIGEAVTAQGESGEIYSIVGEVGLRMNMPEIAEKAFSMACRLSPENKSNYLNLSTSLSKQDKSEEAIELLTACLEKNPEHAAFWSALATVVNEFKSDHRSASLFYDEAIKLSPNTARYHYNKALIGYLSDAADSYYQRAIELEPENKQFQLSYALYLFGRLDVGKALPYYEARLDPELGDNVSAKYTFDIPRWSGECLKGKSIFVYAEQGIGDEIYFTLFTRHLFEMGAQVYIGCDPRLVSLYKHSDIDFAGVFEFQDQKKYRYRERSFPELDAKMSKGHMDIDYAVPMASIPYLAKLNLEQIKNTCGKYLNPPKSDIKLPKLKRPKIGIAWRSGNLKGVRHSYYLDTSLVDALAKSIDADLYVLQYSYNEDEHVFLKKNDNIHFFEGVNLKQDIDANIAILSQLDFCISPPVATAMMALATGTTLCMVNNGQPWTMFGEQPSTPLFPANSVFIHTRSFVTRDFKTTDEIVAEIKTFMDDFLLS